MNGFGGSPYLMYGGNQYGGSYGMQGNQKMQNNNDPNQPPEEQQSFVNNLRTLVSGLSAITGISFGFSTLFRILFKTIKFLNIFKNKKETGDLLDNIWKQTVRRHSQKGIWAILKYFIVGILLSVQFALYYVINKKNNQINNYPVEEIKEEIKVENENEISIEDFMFHKKLGKFNFLN